MSQTQQEPGIPCPQCNNLIKFTVADLLGRDEFYCSHCGLKLSMDRSQSQPAMEVLEQVQVAVEEVNRVKNQYQ